jgi:hypothetical protein
MLSFQDLTKISVNKSFLDSELSQLLDIISFDFKIFSNFKETKIISSIENNDKSLDLDCTLVQDFSEFFEEDQLTSSQPSHTKGKKKSWS